MDERTHIRDAIDRLDTARRNLGHVNLAPGQEKASRAQIEAVEADIIEALDELADAKVDLRTRARRGLSIVRPQPSPA